MTKTLSKLAIAAAAVSIAFAPVAASAGTRASDKPTLYTSAQAQPGQGRSAEGESVAAGTSIIQILIGMYIGAYTTLFIDSVTDDSDEFQSTGI